MKINYYIKNRLYVYVIASDSLIIFDRPELSQELLNLIDKYDDMVYIELNKNKYIRVKENVIKILNFYFGK